MKNKKVLIMCDSFKGSMTSILVNKIISDELTNKGYVTLSYPISDGGEGFLDAMMVVDKYAKKYYLDTYDAIKRVHKTLYLYNSISKTAYFSLGDTVGLSLLKDDERSCFHANTYGLGKLIKEVILSKKVKRIILGIGGSASTDAGTGLLEAMGVLFYDNKGNILHNLDNDSLKDISCVVTCDFDNLIKDIEFITLSDVINPLTGINGAAYVYGPQKGATDSDVLVMDNNLVSFSNITKSIKGYDYSIASGAGAAGGVGFGLLSYCSSKLISGIDYLLESIHFDKLLSKYDMVITGEGKIDNQSFNGKVISGLLKYNPKCIKFVVAVNKVENSKYDIYSIVPTVATSSESLKNPKKYLKELIKLKF